jgi:hypothetical protein
MQSFPSPRHHQRRRPKTPVLRLGRSASEQGDIFGFKSSVRFPRASRISGSRFA